MIGLSFIHFLAIIVYHAFTYLSPCSKILKAVTAVWFKVVNKYYKKKWKQREDIHERIVMNIPEVDYNFASFQEPLLNLN